MIERGRSPGRRFEDAAARLRQQVDVGKLDAEDARWEMLRATLRAQHAHESWVAQGAPRRRAADRDRNN